MILSAGLIIVFCWWLFLVWMNKPLKRQNSCVNHNIYSTEDVSFLIVARNEQKSIVQCLSSIVSEAKSRIKVFLIDDHSFDDTLIKASEFAKTCPQIDLVILESNGVGKKAALSFGLIQVVSPIIYLIDADCILQPGSFDAMLHAASQKDVVAVQGTVIYPDSGFLNKILQVENLNNMVITESMMARKLPGFGNGGNLLFKQSAKQEFEQSLAGPNSSGDDVYFIQQLFNKNLTVCYQPESQVLTYPPESLNEFFNQRIRWARKSVHFGISATKFLSYFVFIIHFALILFTVFTVISDLIFWSLIAWILKIVIEFSYHKIWFLRFGYQHHFTTGFIASLIYPFYAVAIGFLSLIGFKIKWKGRAIRA